MSIFKTGKKIAQPVGLENETYKFLKLRYNERKDKYQNAQDAVQHRLYVSLPILNWAVEHIVVVYHLFSRLCRNNDASYLKKI